MPDQNGTNGSNGHNANGHHLAVIEREKPGPESEYRPEYCELIVAWFSGQRTERVIKKRRVIPQKAGPPAEELEYETLGLALPTLDGFSASIGYTMRSVHRWAKQYPAFGLAFARARQVQRDWLVELATRNLISAGTYGYTMSNISDWRADPKPAIDAGRKAVFFFDPMKDSRELPQGEQRGPTLDQPRVPG